MPLLRAVLLACLSVLLSPLANASPNALDKSRITIGTAADYPPITFQQEGKVSGMVAEFASQLQQRTGKEFTFKVLPWKELIPALQRGEIDMIMSGMSITPERAKQLDFTQSYMNIGQMGIIRVADVSRFNSPTTLLQPGVRLGYVNDTTGAAFVGKYHGEAQPVGFASIEPALSALMSGKIDAVVHDATTSWNIDKDRRYANLISLHRPLTEEQLAWAVAKDQGALLKLLNQQLEQMKQDGSLNRTINTWVPVRASIE